MTFDEQRVVYCEDAIEWIKKCPRIENCSWITSLPDFSEFGRMDLESWKKWFIETSELILNKCPDDGVVIFFQSDIKHEKIWVDKAYLCQKAAETVGANLVWHKIVPRVNPGITTYGRPSYSHVLCFSKKFIPDLNRSTPDVFSHLGDKTWARGMGLEVALMITEFISKQVESKIIINPFCGEGSVLACANRNNLKAIGIERSPKRAKMALKLQVSSSKKEWVL